MTTFPAGDLYPGEDLFPSALGGGIFSRGSAAVALHLDGPVIAAYLGDLLIWDGTLSQFVSAPKASATAVAVAPSVQSQPPAITVPAAVVTAEALPPTVVGGTIIAVPAAAASAAAPVPALSASASIGVPVATASTGAYPPLSDATVTVPAATATAAAHVPGLATTGSSNIGVPTATASASAPTPNVAGSRTVTPPKATASAGATSPAISGAASVTAPIATATASAAAPTAIVSTFEESGMTKSGTQAWSTSAAWVTITSWTANTSTYPGSTVTSNGLDVQGTSNSASLSAAVPYTGAQVGRQHKIRLIDQGGTQIGSESAVVTTTSGTCTINQTGVSLIGITRISVQTASNGAVAGTISSGAGTFLTIT